MTNDSYTSSDSSTKNTREACFELKKVENLEKFIKDELWGQVMAFVEKHSILQTEAMSLYRWVSFVCWVAIVLYIKLTKEIYVCK